MAKRINKNNMTRYVAMGILGASLLAGAGINAASNYLSGIVSNKIFGDSELGRNMGTLFSSGISSAGNTIANNLLKGGNLLKGLG
jgi:hypothetical protein